jgi:hypothetical protein
MDETSDKGSRGRVESCPDKADKMQDLPQAGRRRAGIFGKPIAEGNRVKYKEISYDTK